MVSQPPIFGEAHEFLSFLNSIVTSDIIDLHQLDAEAMTIEEQQREETCETTSQQLPLAKGQLERAWSTSLETPVSPETRRPVVTGMTFRDVFGGSQTAAMCLSPTLCASDLPFSSQLALNLEQVDLDAPTYDKSEFEMDSATSQLPADQTASLFKKPELKLELGQEPEQELEPGNEPALQTFADAETMKPDASCAGSSNGGFGGFSTAGGRKMKPPSDEALRRARQLVDGDASEKENSVPERIRTSAPVSSSRPTDASNSKDGGPTAPAIATGFQTGRGRALPPPSEDAMKRAEALISVDESSSKEQSAPRVPLATPSMGFTTGGGRAMKPPSDEAVRRAHALVNAAEGTSDPDRGRVVSKASRENLPLTSQAEAVHGRGPSTQVSFSTGRGMGLPPPSKAAMAKARALTEEPEVASSSVNATAITLNKKRPAPSPFQAPGSLRSALSRQGEGRVSLPPLSTTWKRPRTHPLPAVKPPVKVVKPPPVALFDLAVTEGRMTLREYFKSAPSGRLQSLSDYLRLGIDERVLRIDSVRAREFCLQAHGEAWGPTQARLALLQLGAQEASLPLDWVANHYRWIVWKFAALIRAFPFHYAPENLSPEYVLQQLLYRYEREVNRCERSAVKKIVERDDAPSRHMCLVIAQIRDDMLELSDGWYSVWTPPLDPHVRTLLDRGALFVGQKLEICGAHVAGEEALPALEAADPTASCKLVIYRNGIRRARWDTRLGFHPHRGKAGFLQRLRSVCPGGGVVPAVRCLVVRVYPLCFREEQSTDDAAGGSEERPAWIVRNQRDHEIRVAELDGRDVRFSAFLRIRVVDALEGDEGVAASTVPVPVTATTSTVTFWSVNEDLMGRLTEGAVLTILGLRANQAGRRGLMVGSGTALSSTKSTRIIVDKHAGGSERVAMLMREHGRHLTPLRDSHFRTALLHSEHDLCGFYLGTCGSLCGWLGDSTGRVLVRLQPPRPATSESSLLSGVAVGELVVVRNVLFAQWDGRHAVAHFSVTEVSLCSRTRRHDNCDEARRLSGPDHHASLARFYAITRG